MLGQCPWFLVYLAGMQAFLNTDRSTEGLSHALAKRTMGGNSCIFSEVSLTLG